MLQTALQPSLSFSQQFASHHPLPNSADSIQKSSSFFDSPKYMRQSSDKDSTTITPFDNKYKIGQKVSIPLCEHDQDQEKWPQIEAVMLRIRVIQQKLRNQRKLNKELQNLLKQYEKTTHETEEQRKKKFQQITFLQEKYTQLQEKIKQLQETILQKQCLVQEKQQFIQQLQYSHVKKINQNEEKIRKINIENKDYLQKLRKANSEIEKQRKSYRELKNTIGTQLQQMQSKKQQLLKQQMVNLKELFEKSKTQTEIYLYEKIQQLSRTIYQQEEQIKKKNIQLNIFQRKKQNSVAQALDKKDQQLKVQKTLYKAQSDKMAKLQQQLKKIKNTKTDSSKLIRSSRQDRSFSIHTPDQEFQLSLSPEKGQK